ncbi:MAG: T9SS type A sorting domain-containing protein [Ignavibacteria bacterium]|nr:T9SS type A sorting domain-containing protein [Ignavibacteria bacterium]MCU7504861.1 T9SS type A sorting domain-containing protein [Ignavibacteria bacterium]MCU7518327.1 T9SS type A sorting domain-containing protein [Ignavibacteria bacterium]
MVADHIGEDPYNSYTYFTPTGYSSNWYYLSSNSNSNAVAIYLVRAYISLEPTDVVEEKGSGIPTKYSLSQNFPNPFNPVTKIRYQIPVSGFVTLKVYDMLGNEVSSLVNEEKSAGEYTVSFDGSRLASGVYFYKLTQGSFTDTKKLILMK